MASKQLPAGDRSKFKMLYVEGDFASGDIPTLAQTLATAVRQPGAVRRIAAPHTAENGAEVREVDAEVAMAVEMEDTGVEEQTPSVVVSKSSSSRTGPRQYYKPKLVDIDLEGDGKSFKEFANEKKPETQRDKYLVAAAWLHNHGNPKLEAITVDHVWTCYQAAGWTYDVQDPAVVFRQLRQKGRGTFKDRKFSINQIGLAKVKEMKPST